MREPAKKPGAGLEAFKLSNAIAADRRYLAEIAVAA
jgi:hypothetical protein